MIDIHRSTYALGRLDEVLIITVEPGTEIEGHRVDDTNYVVHPSGSTIWMTKKNFNRLKDKVDALDTLG